MREAVEVIPGTAAGAAGGIVGSHEAAELLGIDRTTIGRWRKQGYLPLPDWELRSGPVWVTDRLIAFRDSHRQQADAAGRRPIARRAEQTAAS